MHWSPDPPVLRAAEEEPACEVADDAEEEFADDAVEDTDDDDDEEVVVLEEEETGDLEDEDTVEALVPSELLPEVGERSPTTAIP